MFLHILVGHGIFVSLLYPKIRTAQGVRNENDVSFMNIEYLV